jgi:hypothetical protein
MSIRNISIAIITYISILGLNTSVAQGILTTPLFDNNKNQSIQFYDFLEDQKGFLWVGSNNGIFRYDGVHLVNYVKKDKTYFEDIFSIFEIEKNRVWFSSPQTGVVYYDYNKKDLVVPIWNDALIAQIGDRWISDLFIAPDSSLWLQKFSFGYDSTIHIFQIKQDRLIQYSFGPSSDMDAFLEQHHFTAKQEKLFAQIKQKNLASLSKPDSIFLGINKNSIVSYNTFFNLKDQRKYSPNVLRKIIHIDKENRFGLTFNGFIQYPNKENSTVFLPQYQINDIYKLSNGNYLFSTNKYGVLSSSSIEIRKHKFQQKEEVVIAIHVDKGTLYLRTKDNVYYKSPTMPSLKLLLSINQGYQSLNNPKQFLVWNDKIILNDLTIFEKTQEILVNLEIRKVTKGRTKSIQPINDSLLIISTANGFVTLDKNRALASNSQTLGYNTWTYTTSLVAPSKVWLGTLNGIMEYDYKSHLFDSIPLPLNNLRIKEIKGNKKKCVFVGSERNGLFILSPNQPTIPINLQQKLNSNSILSLLLENDTTAWIGTNNGLNKVIFSPHNAATEVSSYLTGVHIDDLEWLGDSILAVGDGVLLCFPKQIKKLEEKRASISINGLQINGRQESIYKQKISLQRDENTIQINFTSINFSKGRPTIFRYALLSENNLDTTWQSTQEYSVTYSLLKPGSYTFLLTTQDEQDKETPNIQQLEINIQKYFVDTIYFHILIYILSILGVIAIALICILFLNRRAELKKSLVESQLKVLRTQMNPHFLFNTLNSILGHITMQNLWAATMYLSDFSKLVRDILENSKHSFLPLDKELEMLNAYIKLEKMRLGEAYRIEIEIKEGVELNSFYIPPMLIQPFIENAIIHGLGPQEGGEIIVLIENIESEVLKITISDTGIGRKASMKRHSEWANISSKTSLGIENVRERIAIINKTYHSKFNFSIEDLFNEKEEPLGTKVQILLPKFDYIKGIDQ